MSKEAIKREVKDLLEDSSSAVIKDLSFHDKRFYKIYDAFYMENNLRYASMYVHCLID